MYTGDQFVVQIFRLSFIWGPDHQIVLKTLSYGLRVMSAKISNFCCSIFYSSFYFHQKIPQNSYPNNLAEFTP